MHHYDLVTCRRVNYIQAAMVQAAIAIQRSHGTSTATAVLESERLPQAVIDRVLSTGARTRSCPYTAFEPTCVPDT
ncbi:hypothetical protein [Massilia sp. METH4]|uniref:hypothetical protein n=1 Tax=Massilia sp. METH4 TaxID=3123041 RepID=UPI0030CB1672